MIQRPKRVIIHDVYRCHCCVDKTGKQSEFTSDNLDSHLFTTKKELKE